MSVDATEARLSTHEAVCAERYSNITERVGRLENIMIGTAGGVVLQLLAIVAYFFTKG